MECIRPAATPWVYSSVTRCSIEASNPRFRIGPRLRYVATFEGNRMGPPSSGGITPRAAMRFGLSVIGWYVPGPVGTTPRAGFCGL